MQKMLDNQKESKISIIVPIYNISMYLSQCVESILAQTYEDIEIILVDDGSTDASGSICDSYANADSRIIVIHKKNEGLVAARKSGYEIARGQYILNVDGDDWIEANMVETLYRVMKADGVDIVQAGYYIEGPKSRYQDYLETRNCYITGAEQEDFLLKWMNDAPILDNQIFTKLFRTEIIKRAYANVPNDNSNGEDYIAFINLLSTAKNISVIPDILYHYRERDNSLSHSRDGLRLLFAEAHLYKFLLEEIKSLFPQIDSGVVNQWIFRKMLSKMNFTASQYNTQLTKFFLSDIERFLGKNVVIYGAGAVGKDYIYQLMYHKEIKVVAWVDSNYADYAGSFVEVKNPECLFFLEVDYVIIAVKNRTLAREIKVMLKEKYRINNEKVIWDFQ